MNIEKETQSIKLYSGKCVNIVKSDRSPNASLTRRELSVLHLMPNADPVAFSVNEKGEAVFYFSPDNVSTTPPELWYPEEEAENIKPITLDDGSIIPFLDRDSCESIGYFSKEHLDSLHLSVVESPVAYTNKPDSDGDVTLLYDIKTCVRQALKCVRCGKEDRFKNKLCRKCYEKDMLKRRKIGDAYRASVTGIDRSKAIFFDLELTGVYPYDEIISVSITDGWGNEIMDTLVRPEKRRQWNITVKIHGITPKMTKYAPYLSEITPQIKEILLGAEIIVAYGISTDYSHIKKIFTEDEQQQLLPKLRDCAKEYVRYISEYEPDINKSSLVSATEYFGIEWSGTAHTSMADTHSCRILWEKLFPSCYTMDIAEKESETELTRKLKTFPAVNYITFDDAAERAKNDKSSENEDKRAKEKERSGNKHTENRSKRRNAQRAYANPNKTEPKKEPQSPIKEEKAPASAKKNNGIVGFWKKLVGNEKKNQK